MKGSQFGLQKDLAKIPKNITLSLSPILPQSDLCNCILGKKNNQTFWGLLDTDSELTPSPGDSKQHFSMPDKVGAYGG